MTSLDPLFEPELRRLAHTTATYTEAWRALIPVAKRLERPRPSYDSVRRFVAAERERLRDAELRRLRQQERVINPLLAGRIPRWP